MQTEWFLEFSNRLNSSPESVWKSVSNMRGVNEELMPILRMTYPPTAAAGDLSQAQTGVFLFYSWLLLGGILPIDRHHLRLTRIEPGRGFVEESESWTQRYWRHERFIEPESGGCSLTDQLTFRPRLPFAGPLVNWFVRRLFTHRHARLKQLFD